MTSKKFKLEVEPGLKEFFESVALSLSGPRPTCFAREECGAATRDAEDRKELDPEWTERCLFEKCCFVAMILDALFHKVQTEQQRFLKEWKQSIWNGCKDCGRHCSLTAFWNHWKEHCGNIVVRKPSRDIRGICYQFHLGNRKACA